MQEHTEANWKGKNGSMVERAGGSERLKLFEWTKAKKTTTGKCSLKFANPHVHTHTPAGCVNGVCVLSECSHCISSVDLLQILINHGRLNITLALQSTESTIRRKMTVYIRSTHTTINYELLTLHLCAPTWREKTSRQAHAEQHAKAPWTPATTKTCLLPNTKKNSHQNTHYWRHRIKRGLFLK